MNSFTRRGFLSMGGIALGAQRTIELPDSAVSSADGDNYRLRTQLCLDKAVALHFIFTRCQTACPLSGALFRRAQALVQESQQRVRFLSVSVDPEHDTPQQLRRFLTKYGALPFWHAVRMAPGDLKEFLDSIGENGNVPSMHSTQVLIFGPDGKLSMRLPDLPSSNSVANELMRVLSKTA